MSAYTYKIITAYHGTTVPEWELNEAGRNGFKLVAQTPLNNVFYSEEAPDGESTVTPVATQLIMEKEIGDQDVE